MASIERAIGRARRRMLMQRWLDRLAWALAAGLGAALLALLADRLMAVPVPVAAYGVIGGLAVLIALIAGYVGRPGEQDAAVRIDAGLGLKDRLGTALYLQQSKADHPMAQSVVRDAEQAATSAVVSRATPIGVGRSWWVPVGLGAVFAAVWFVPPMDLLAIDQQRQAAAEEEQRAEEAERRIVNAQALVKQMDTQEGELNEADPTDLFTELASLTRRDLSNPDVKRKTLEQLDSVQDRLKQAADAKEQEFKTLQNQMSQIDAGRPGPADRFADAMRRGDFEAAQRELQQIADRFEQMTDEEKAAAAQQLQQMATQMQSFAQQQAAAAQQTQQNIQQQLANQGLSQQQINQLQQQGFNQQAVQQALQQQYQQQGMSPQQAQQQAQQAAQQQQQAQSQQQQSQNQQQLGQSLQQMSQAMQQGQSQQSQQAQQQQSQQQQQQQQQGGQQNQQMSQQQAAGQCQSSSFSGQQALQQMQSMQNQLNQMQLAQQQLQQAQQQMGQQSPQGQQQPGQQGGQPGQGTGAGQQAQGGGQGGQQAGTGEGGNPLGATRPGYNPNSYVSEDYQDRQGRLIASWMEKGENAAGESTVEFDQAVSSAVDDAERAVTDDRVPRRYHEAIRHYFQQLPDAAEDTRRAPRAPGG
ncbi:MAG: hypothetical protein AAFY08_09810 [Planctomycetota bacterium]